MTSMLDTNESMSVSERVIAAVAAATDTDPLELEPLYTRIDPDCLDSIFDGESSGRDRNLGQITFPMAGRQVVVNADGTVDVSAQDASDEPAPVSEPARPAVDAAPPQD